MHNDTTISREVEASASHDLATAFLAENAIFLPSDDPSTAAICQIPDTAWPAVVAAVDEYTGGGIEPGIDCAVAVTRETLDEFRQARREHWRERGTEQAMTIGGYRGLLFRSFQLHKGAERRDMLVLDIGTIRVSLY